MKKYTIKKKILYAFYILCMLVCLGGCANKEEEQNAEVRIADYQKDTYQTTTVQKGTIQPKLTLTLKPDEYEVISYSITKEMLTVSELNVEKGGRVEAGAVMVSFQNDGIEETIAEYQQRKEEDALLIEHYTKLSKIDSQTDYSGEIEKLKNDQVIANLYIEEQKSLLANYQLVAEKSGIVTEISEALYQGYATSDGALIRVASGSSNYIAVTSDDFAFCEGDIYEAQFENAVYEMRVTDVAEEKNQNRITFEPVSDMTGISETDELTMEIEKPPIENVVYVEENAILTVEDRQYAFLLDENGFREAVPVQVQAVADGYAIIASGLAEGEQVTLN